MSSDRPPREQHVEMSVELPFAGVLMIEVDPSQSPVVAAALSTPCWWVDLGDRREATHHHATREAVEADYVNRGRGDAGWGSSVADVSTLVSGVVRQETYLCYRVTCPACDTVQHHRRTRFVACVECGHGFGIEYVVRPRAGSV